MTTQHYDPSMPLPVISPENAPFWEGCKQRVLRLQKCQNCGKFRYYPRPGCPYCGSLRFAWEQVSGQGKVVSWVIHHHPTLPAFQAKVPYNVVLVELKEEVRMVSNLVDCKNEDIRDGMPVTVTFEDVSEDVTLPRFRPAGKSAS